jgi:hypothetical protein
MNTVLLKAKAYYEHCLKIRCDFHKEECQFAKELVLTSAQRGVIMEGYENRQ